MTSISNTDKDQAPQTPASTSKTLTCDQCGKDFPNNLQFRIHQRVHAGKEIYNCKECGKDFLSLFYLKRHGVVHGGEKSFKCDECGKAYGASGHLLQHKRYHTGERPYTCKDWEGLLLIKSLGGTPEDSHWRETIQL